MTLSSSPDARRTRSACVLALLLAAPLAAQPALVTLGGTGSDVGQSVAVTADGGTVVTGSFAGTVDFDPGPGKTNLTSVGEAFNDADIFVARYSASGALVSAIRIGGTLNDRVSDVAVDASGNAVVTGYFQGTADFDPGPGTMNLTSAGGLDVFVARYTPSGALALVPTSAEDVPEATGFHVSEIAPNPSRGAARLSVAVDRAQQVVVSVYDVLGRRVAVPFAGRISPEAPEAVEVSGLNAGTYMVHVVGDTFRATRGLVRVR